jgi:hypothetical protein
MNVSPRPRAGRRNSGRRAERWPASDHLNDVGGGSPGVAGLDRGTGAAPPSGVHPLRKRCGSWKSVTHWRRSWEVSPPRGGSSRRWATARCRIQVAGASSIREVPCQTTCWGKRPRRLKRMFERDSSGAVPVHGWPGVRPGDWAAIGMLFAPASGDVTRRRLRRRRGTADRAEDELGDPSGGPPQVAKLRG